MSADTPAAPMPGAAKGWGTPPSRTWAESAPEPAAPAAPPAKLSRYQRLMAQAGTAKQSWGAPTHQAPPAPMEPEDFIPSDDDEELENSTTFGRQAFERILDATLIEELDSHGQPIAHHR